MYTLFQASLNIMDRNNLSETEQQVQTSINEEPSSSFSDSVVDTVMEAFSKVFS